MTPPVPQTPTRPLLSTFADLLRGNHSDELRILAKQFQSCMADDVEQLISIASSEHINNNLAGPNSHQDNAISEAFVSSQGVLAWEQLADVRVEEESEQGYITATHTLKVREAYRLAIILVLMGYFLLQAYLFRACLN
jgi:hypothetical protein